MTRGQWKNPKRGVIFSTENGLHIGNGWPGSQRFTVTARPGAGRAVSIPQYDKPGTRTRGHSLGRDTSRATVMRAQCSDGCSFSRPGPGPRDSTACLAALCNGASTLPFRALSCLSPGMTPQLITRPDRLTVRTCLRLLGKCDYSLGLDAVKILKRKDGGY